MTGELIFGKNPDQSACPTLFGFLLFGFPGTLMFAGFYVLFRKFCERFRGVTHVCRNCRREMNLPVFILVECPFPAVKFFPGLQPTVQERLKIRCVNMII